MPLTISMRKALISLALAILASVSSVVIPTYTRVSVQENSVSQAASFSPATETPVLPARHATLAEVYGSGSYFLLIIPLTLAALPLLLRLRGVRILSAVLITGWVVIGAASIGLFYLPSAIMMIWSATGKSGSSESVVRIA